jgi:hypothetical protein
MHEPVFIIEGRWLVTTEGDAWIEVAHQMTKGT